MIGDRVEDELYGFGTIVAETDKKYMVQYDETPWNYKIYDKEEQNDFSTENRV